jgi:hypothetical protein
LFVGLSRIDLMHNCHPASIKIKILLIVIANLCIVCIRLQFVYWNMLLKYLKTHADVHGDDDVTAQIPKSPDHPLEWLCAEGDRLISMFLKVDPSLTDPLSLDYQPAREMRWALDANAMRIYARNTCMQ